MPKYEVIVGNIGVIYSGNNQRMAGQSFAAGLKTSKDPGSRGYNEPVTMLDGLRSVQEYNPSNQIERTLDKIDWLGNELDDIILEAMGPELNFDLRVLLQARSKLVFWHNQMRGMFTSDEVQEEVTRGITKTKN